MTKFSDDLTNLRDDMVAFIEGHGMRRYPGGVDYEFVPSVLWKPGNNPESWKDFVETAKAAGSPFVTMDSWRLQRDELEEMLERFASPEFSAGEDDMEDARWLRTYLGKTGFVQLGFAHQGVMMIYEVTTEWYDRFQHLIEMFDEFGGAPMDRDKDMDEPGPDEI